MAYVNSSALEVFPSALRSQSYKGRFTSETNLTGIVRSVTDTEKYVISWEPGDYKLVINGYYFTFSTLPDGLGNTIYAHIRTDSSNRLVSYNTGSTVLDTDSGFLGLLLNGEATTTPSTQNSDQLYHLQILNNGVVVNRNKINASSISAETTYDPTSTTPISGSGVADALNLSSVTIGSGDSIVIVDSSDSNTLHKSDISFDGSTITKALSQKGTWEKFNDYVHPSGDGNMHVPATGTTNNGKFLKAGSSPGSLSWANVTKSDVGLGNVENTDLSTWTGSENITIIGTISTGTVPLNNISGADDLKAIEALSGTSGILKKTNTNTWVLDTTNYTTASGTVTSVRVQATSPVQSSQSAAQTGTLNTTISLADGYGDTKNPYASKTKNTVLAAPSNADGTPSFRTLVAADIPNLNASKITAGTLAVARGGTGKTALTGSDSLRSAIGLGSNSGALEISNGGTGLNPTTVYSGSNDYEKFKTDVCRIFWGTTLGTATNAPNVTYQTGDIFFVLKS